MKQDQSVRECQIRTSTSYTAKLQISRMSSIATNYQDKESESQIEITKHRSKAGTYEAMDKSYDLVRLLHDMIRLTTCTIIQEQNTTAYYTGHMKVVTFPTWKVRLFQVGIQSCNFSIKIYIILYMQPPREKVLFRKKDLCGYNRDKPKTIQRLQYKKG